MVNHGTVAMNADSKAIPFSDKVAIITAAINSVRDPIVSFNDEGMIQWANQAFQNLVGKSEADLVNQSFSQIMPLQLEGRFILFTGKFDLPKVSGDEPLARNTQIIPIDSLDELIHRTTFLYLKNHQEPIIFSINHQCHVLGDQCTRSHILTMHPIDGNYSVDGTTSKLVSNVNLVSAAKSRKSIFSHDSSAKFRPNLSDIVHKYQHHHHQLISTNQQLRLIITNMPMIILVTDQDGIVILCEGRDLGKINLNTGDLIGHSIFDIYANQPTITNSVQRCLAGEHHSLSHYWHDLYFEIEYIPFINSQGEKHGALIVGTDVTEQFQYAESARLQNWRSVIFSNIAVKIHQSLDMDEILQTTVREVRNFLSTDRVLIYRFNSDWSGDVVVESVAENWSSTLGLNIIDTCFMQGMWQEYQNGKYVAIDDIYNSHLSPCHRSLLEGLEVRSNLVVPIIENEKLWGLLIAHHCSEKRHWKKIELELLIQLATQLSIALYQAHLLNQETSQRKLLAQQNTELELARREAETATIMKSTFLATMSHEIRTPMNAVLGMTGLLMDTNLNPEQLDFVSTIRFSGETLLSIINEILDFSKLESQEMELEILNFNLLNCIEDCTDLLANSAHNQGIDLYSWIDVNLPHELRGDVTRLKQVIINLINNAIKFTSQGEVIIQASLIAEYSDQVLIRISIRDTGIGIPETKISKLFTPFTQVDASTTRKYGGTGLGLAISKQLVDLMGGEIGVISEESKGSEFWFEVPFTKHSSLKSNNHNLSKLKVLVNCRVLVIDRHHTNCKLIDYQLSSCQMWVDTCEDSITAWDLLVNSLTSGKPYQIIILDIQNDVNAESLTRYIKTHPRLKDIHLVMVTSWQQRSIAQKYREMGFSACLNKPIKQSILIECLADIMTFGYYNPETKYHLHQQQNYLHTNPKTKGKSSKLKILLVEDSLINQKVIINQLRNLGYTTDVSGNGKEALDLLEQIAYDMVLMDCQMPELDGYDTTRAIRQLKPPQCNVVIIAMTANAMQEDRQRCLDCGMNDYLSKPIIKELLQDKITTWEKYISDREMLYSATKYSQEPPMSPEIATSSLLDVYPETMDIINLPHTTSNNFSIPMTLHDYSSQNSLESTLKNYNPDNKLDSEIIAASLGMVSINQIARDLPLIDWDYLHSISGNDVEFEKDLLQTFIDGVPEILDTLILAMESQNFALVVAQAHLLKGSAASTGIQFIAQLAAAMEMGGKKISAQIGTQISAHQESQATDLNTDLNPDWNSQIALYLQINHDYINAIRHHLIELANDI